MKNYKHAYTLAEVMIVMLILTVLFAVFAPLFTGRTLKNYKSKYDVWDWVGTQFNAKADPGTVSQKGQLFFGVSPKDADAVNNVEFLPYSKLVIRSGEIKNGKIQKHIQFKTRARGNSDGTFGGTWFVDGRNMLLGGSYPNITTGNKNNVAIGYMALDSLNSSNWSGSIRSGYNNTAIGYYALNSLTTGYRNTAFGTNAGSSNETGYDNVFMGYYAGQKATGSQNVAIGKEAMADGYGGYGNTYVGIRAGYSNTSGYNNVAIGYKAMENVTEGHHNIAIGYNALKNLTTGAYNVAIGYNACADVTAGNKKTCIGYNSGPHSPNNRSLYGSDNRYKGNDSNTTTAEFMHAWEDNVQRTYIGSKPYNFPGDAVLEIHNPALGDWADEESCDTKQYLSYNTGIPYITSKTSGKSGLPSNTTTVINGNLIVRGRPYFTIGNTLHHFYDMKTGLNVDDQKIYLGLYGYATNTDDYYANCKGLQDSYNFNDKCINLNTSTSDRRLKNIGSKFTTGLDKLRELKVYNYNFKNDKNKEPHVGVIAQELMKVFPNSVFKAEDGYLRIRWDEMFYAVINGIKELDKKIAAIIKRTTNVEYQISNLEKENLILKSQVDNLSKRVNKLKAQ